MSALRPLFLSYMEVGFYSVVGGLFLLLVWLILSQLRVNKSLFSIFMLIFILRMLIPVNIPSEFSAFRYDFLDDNVFTAEDFNHSYSSDVKIALDIPGGGNEFDRAVDAGVPVQHMAYIIGERFNYNGAFYYEDEFGNITPARPEMETLVPTLAKVWLGGVTVMLLYTFISWLILRYKLSFAVKEDGYWLSDRIKSPCVVGILRPKIYLTFGLSEEEKKYILAHETEHIRRGDHILKTLSWLAACLHWYHLHIWMFHKCFADILEEACDQRAVKKLGTDEKENYAEALLSVASGKKFSLPPTPVSFTESDTKFRVKQVLKYKKPLISTTALSFAIIAWVSLCFLTVPADARLHSTDSIAVSSYLENITGRENINTFHHWSHADQNVRIVAGIADDRDYVLAFLLDGELGGYVNLETLVFPDTADEIVTHKAKAGDWYYYVALCRQDDVGGVECHLDGKVYGDSYPYGMAVFHTEKDLEPEWIFYDWNGHVLNPPELKQP